MTDAQIETDWMREREGGREKGKRETDRKSQRDRARGRKRQRQSQRVSLDHSMQIYESRKDNRSILRVLKSISL